MSYFTQFNYTLYPDFQNKNQFLILKNITSRVVRNLNVLDDKSVYYTYIMKEEESIEDVSNIAYGTPTLYWILMIINNRFDRFYDFPLSSANFNEYIIEKYGSIEASTQLFSYFKRTDELQYSDNEDIDDSFFYEVTQNVYDNTAEYINGVLMRKSKSKYDLELEQNESKREILILNSNIVDRFVNEFNKLIA